MRGTENLEMEPDQLCEDNIYANTCDLDVRRTRNRSTAKEILAVRSRKYRVILILGVLLILAFLILFILTGVLFNHYKKIEDAISQLKSNDKKIEEEMSQLKDKIIEEEMTQQKANYKNIEDEILQLKSKDSGLTKDVSDLQKSVANITDDLNKIKLIINKEASCTSCPSGWQLIKSNCYYIQANGETWTRSREECDKRNGVMLILKDKAELDSLVPTIGSGRYWIGLRRDSGDINRWLWADGSHLTFSPWNTGEPNNDKGREHCAEILGGSQSMNDRDCEDKLGYICEKAWTC
ncbi:CD209 antigen-like protein C isoform X2 [Rana temporaria]|uniref:CD209 antigen-like protein C isoform X2 n=1 Tax=Rana temporaria TaxID=8407 RepID=UPI001AACFCB7|nr:CD209 antigen-like protein C isoform X2 [Rana temporaria]